MEIFSFLEYIIVSKMLDGFLTQPLDTSKIDLLTYALSKGILTVAGFQNLTRFFNGIRNMSERTTSKLRFKFWQVTTLNSNMINWIKFPVRQKEDKISTVSR